MKPDGKSLRKVTGTSSLGIFSGQQKWEKVLFMFYLNFMFCLMVSQRCLLVYCGNKAKPGKSLV